MITEQELEALWGGILSEEERKVRAAFASLDVEEGRRVVDHLRRMADPAEGYAAGQQEAARFALGVLAED